MNRGIKTKQQPSTEVKLRISNACNKMILAQCGVLLGLSLISASQSFAGSTGRAIESNFGKSIAPTKEDSADYFSTQNRGVSPEDAQQADQLRIKTMSSIKTLLADKKNARQEYELMVRLGELHIERADYMRDLEIQEYVKNFKAWEATSEKTRSKTPPVVNYKNSEACLYNAVQVFRKLVNSYPTHPRTDMALYSLARTLGRLDDQNAVQYYKQLITSHPKSPLVPDAYLAMGEYYFDKHKIKEAMESYQKVMDFKAHRAYPYSIYKLGWCFYNNQDGSEKSTQENLKKSIASFQLVVKLAEKQKNNNFNLRDEALRDLIMVYAESEDTEGAWTYFKSINEENRFYTMLDRLGTHYANAGKNTKAIEVYTRLVSESPNRLGNPQIHQKLVTLYDDSQKFPEVIATLAKMKKLYVSESAWISANKSKPDAIKEAYTVTERTMHRYGTMFHSRGQKIKNNALENHAAEIYEMYLDSFASLEPAYEIRFYLADIQMAQKKYAVASTNFIMVARQKPKDGKHLKDAAYNAVDALASLNSISKFAPVPPPGQSPSELEIPKIKKIYIDTIDFYVQTLPNEKAGMPMRYTAAQIYFDYGHYSEANKRFDVLATNFGSTKQGQTSARTIIAYFNQKGDWNNVISYGKKYQLNKELTQDNNVKIFIDESLRSAIFNSAIAAEKVNDHTKAAALFADFQKLFPQDHNADRALYNASLNQFKAGKVEESIATQKQLLTIYPKSELGPDVTASMAETYEAIAKFQSAAETYKKFAATYPNDKRAPISLFNAGVLYRGINRMESASASFSELYNKYPNSPTANDALFESARIKESSKDLKGAIADYNLFASNPSNKNKDEGLYATAKSSELKLMLDPKNETALRDIGKLSNILRSKNAPQAALARQIVGKILFNEQESQTKSFNALTLDNGQDFNKTIEMKQAKLVKLATAYQEVIEIGNAEYGIASLYRLGEVHENFANTLFNASAPKNHNQKQAAEFKSQLERAGFPLKEKAYTYFETAYRQSSEVETFTIWTQKTYQKMAQLAPQKHPVIEEQSASPTYMSYKVSINKATNNLAE